MIRCLHPRYLKAKGQIESIFKSGFPPKSRRNFMCPLGFYQLPAAFSVFEIVRYFNILYGVIAVKSLTVYRCSFSFGYCFILALPAASPPNSGPLIVLCGTIRNHTSKINLTITFINNQSNSSLHHNCKILSQQLTEILSWLLTGDET